MHIELWPIGHVVPYEKTRRINVGAVDAVVKSIPEFAERQPIVVDLSYALAGGRTLAEVREAVGHAKMRITSGYLHVAVDDEAAVATLFP